jgi:hypothetical protein
MIGTYICAYLILILSISALVNYRITKHYLSLNGLLMVLLAIGLLSLRIFALSGIRTNILSLNTLQSSITLTIPLTLILSLILLIIRKNKNVNPGKAFLLFLYYIPFGIIQQLFFQFVFLETLYFLLPNLLVCIPISAIFYYLFHPRKDFKILSGATLFIGLIWSSIYLNYGNIITIGISHAFLGMMYYSLMREDNTLEPRLRYLSKDKRQPGSAN